MAKIGGQSNPTVGSINLDRNILLHETKTSHGKRCSGWKVVFDSDRFAPNLQSDPSRNCTSNAFRQSLGNLGNAVFRPLGDCLLFDFSG